MRWRGIAIGGYFGWLCGGPVGGCLGALIGHKLESLFGGAAGARQRVAGEGGVAFGSAVAEAYAVLGVSPQSDDATVKAAYRSKAKLYHPDTLRAQGLSEAMVERATAMMSRVNAAWTVIKNERKL